MSALSVRSALSPIAFATAVTMTAFGLALVSPQSATGVGETLVTIPLPAGAGPEAVAVGPDGTVYSVNRDLGTISRIPPGAAAVAENLPTAGRVPYSAAVDSAGKVFVTNRSSGTVARIEPGRMAVPRTFAVGDQPWGIAVTTDDTIFATTYGADTVVRIDAGSNVVSATYPLAAGSDPKDVAVSPVDGHLFIAASGTGNVADVDPDTGVVRYIPLPAGAFPRGIAVATDGSVYVTDIGLEAVHWIRSGADRVATTTTYPVDTFPSDVAADPDGSVLVSLYGPSRLVRMRGGAPVDAVELGESLGPDRLTVAQDGTAYTADFEAGSVTRVIPAPRPEPVVSVVMTLRPTKVRRHSAVLRGRVTAGAHAVVAELRLWRNADLTRTIRAKRLGEVRAGSSVVVRARVKNLRSHHRFWLRATGVSDGDQLQGRVRSFRTK